MGVLGAGAFPAPPAYLSCSLNYPVNILCKYIIVIIILYNALYNESCNQNRQ
jgi:hypothetical protein